MRKSLGEITIAAIRSALKKRNMTQAHFAKAIGASRQRVNYWFKKKILIPSEYWRPIEETLETPIFDGARKGWSGKPTTDASDEEEPFPAEKRAEKREDVLAFIKKYIATQQRSPSYKDIADAIGISEKGAQNIVRELKHAGHLTLGKPGHARTIRLRPTHLYEVSVPIAELDLVPGDYLHAIDNRSVAITKRIP